MTPSQPRPWARRQLLRSGAVAFAGAGAGWTAAATLVPTEDQAISTVEEMPPYGGRTVAFHGSRQAGVTTPAQAHLSLLGIDLEPHVHREDLARLLTLLSDDAARLTQGRMALADTEPELATAPAQLTMTFGFGPDVTRRFWRGSGGIVRPLPAFRTDRLDDDWGQTDLAVQICAEDPMAVAHARRMILKDLEGLARPRWVQHGYRRAYGAEVPGTTMRNVMGQVDGTANPRTEDDLDDLVWSQAPGFAGGTSMVVRRIRTNLDTWDRVDRNGREAVIGRRLDTGAPLTGVNEHEAPDLEARNSLGLPVIDPASHVARARSTDPRQRFLRRPYNYTVPDPTRPTGEDSGLVFIAFAADLERQFVPVQRRLAETDRLNEWVSTIGSAVYAVPPGVAQGKYVGLDQVGA